MTTKSTAEKRRKEIRSNGIGFFHVSAALFAELTRFVEAEGILILRFEKDSIEKFREAL